MFPTCKAGRKFAWKELDNPMNNAYTFTQMYHTGTKWYFEEPKRMHFSNIISFSDMINNAGSTG